MFNIYLSAVIIAIVEGLTEFIPISSTGHMILVGDLLAFTGEKAATFEIFIQLGAILAAFLIYKDKFLGLIPKKHGGNWLTQILKGETSPTGLHLVWAILPIALAGLLLHKTIKTHLFSPITVAIGLIVGGVLMIIVERLPIKQSVETVEKISIRQALIIGIGQCFAIWPGMSRSGSTMITGLLLGVKHKAAADFSFIIAVPVMCAAVGYDLLKSWHFLELGDLPYFLIGFLVAFIVGWLSIKWFLSILERLKLMPFGIYRVILGGICLWFFQ
ncbi:undecaprenyl-diphosphate phosphatase [bacterium]|nr:undecaprenyl-diphosphate phosphatase [bacterium]